MAQSTITIEVNWPNWSSENRVTFRDPSNNQIGAQICNPGACFTGGTNTAYNNLASPETYLSVPYGNGYSVFLEDDFGDGWNGFNSYIRIYQDGVLIVDDDLPNGFTTTVNFDIIAPAPSLSVLDQSLDEDAGNMVFTVTHLGLDAAGPFSANFSLVDVTTTSGLDYTATAGTLNFTGTSGDIEQIVVPIRDDSDLEGDETFTVQFNSITDPAIDITATATGTIVDNESDPNATRPYEERYTENVIGNFIMRGNTNLICVSGCPATPVSNNPGVVMGYANSDADPATINLPLGV